MNILWHSMNILLYIKIWLLIDKLKVYGIQLKKLGLGTSWGGGRRYFWEVATLSGGRYFQDLLAATKNWRYFRGVAIGTLQ